MLYKSKTFELLELLDIVGMYYGYCSMGPRGRFYPYLNHCNYIGLPGTGFMQVFYLGRAPRTKETLPDFSEVASGNPTSTCIPRVDG